MDFDCKSKQSIIKLMILIAHIVIALSSVIFASLLLARPSRMKVNINYGFIAATIVTGTYLIVTMHVNMLSTCATGLTYLAVVAVLTALAQRRLASQKAN